PAADGTAAAAASASRADSRRARSGSGRGRAASRESASDGTGRPPATAATRAASRRAASSGGSGRSASSPARGGSASEPAGGSPPEPGGNSGPSVIGAAVEGAAQAVAGPLEERLDLDRGAAELVGDGGHRQLVEVLHHQDLAVHGGQAAQRPDDLVAALDLVPAAGRPAGRGRWRTPTSAARRRLGTSVRIAALRSVSPGPDPGRRDRSLPPGRTR